jgi:A/G-specific adenine glycosylase
VVFNLELPARSPQGERLLWGYAAENLPAGRAGDYNQALMDLGAVICTPHAPACLTCPLENMCQARLLGVQEERPVMQARRPIPHYLVTAAVIQRAGQVLIARRPEKRIVGRIVGVSGG